MSHHVLPFLFTAGLLHVGLCAQIDSSWTITINGQVVQGEPNGTFRVPNVSAPDLFGIEGPGTPPDFRSDDFLRMIAVREADGALEYAFSERFQIDSDETYQIRDITFTSTPPRSINFLRVSAAASVLTLASPTIQLSTEAQINDGTMVLVDVTARTEWTTYRTSNPDILRVGPNGLVTALGEGVAFVTAVNEGVSAVTEFEVVGESPLTDVVGFVLGVQGDPIPGAEVQLPQYGLTVFADQSGRFEVVDLPVNVEDFDVLVSGLAASGDVVFGSRSDVVPSPGAATDVGVVVALAVPCDFDPQLGAPLGLGDDQVVGVSLGFEFPFGAATHTSMWISSNGNVQFQPVGSPGLPGTDPAAWISNQTSIMPGFTDLDPSAGGDVYVRLGAEDATVTWLNVPEFALASTHTFQLNLRADGTFSFVYDQLDFVGALTRSMIVGVSPGGLPQIQIQDLASPGASSAAGEALVGLYGAGASEPNFVPGCLAWTLNQLQGYDLNFVTGVVTPPTGLVQSGSASTRIRGIVRDALGVPTPFASVSLGSSFAAILEGAGDVRAVVADAGGRFVIDDVPLGQPARLVAWRPQSQQIQGSATVHPRLIWRQPYVTLRPVVTMPKNSGN